MDLLRAGGTGDFPAAELVYGELIGNAVRHAPGRILVQLDWKRRHAGAPRPRRGRVVPAGYSPPEDPMCEHGRGLFIVRALALSFDVENIVGDGSQVCARLPVHRAA